MIGAAPSSWRALAVVEGRRLTRHPAFLTGVVFTLIGSVVFVRATLTGQVTTWDEDGWTAVAGFLLLAVLTMVAANLSALRDRREDTTEQHTALPVGRSTRTGALLAATLWPAAAGAVLLGAVAGYAATQVPLTSTDRAHLLEAVAVVVMLGALGITLATWLPSPFVAPAAAWGLLFLSPGEDPSHWFVLAPFTGLRDPVLSMVHLAYVLGLATVLGALAVARTDRTRPVILAGLAGGAVVIATAAVLISGVCSASGTCVI